MTVYELARKVLLPLNEVKMWIEHLKTVADNREVLQKQPKQGDQSKGKHLMSRIRSVVEHVRYI